MNKMNTELYEKLSRLQWLMHKHLLRTHAQSGPMADPTRGQGRIFAILKMQDGISTKDLSYLLGIRVSSLNELLLKMEKNGYITREPSEADRRVMLVKLTEKGKNEEQQKWNPGDIFGCLSENEQEEFADYLNRVVAALEADIGGEADEDERDWWMRRGREHMGDEMFEHLSAMTRRGFECLERFDPLQFSGLRGFGGFPYGGHRSRPANPAEYPHKPEDE